MFIVDQEQIDNIYNKINGLAVYSFEGDSIIDPAWDIGDLLIIDNKKVIFQGSADFGGKWKASISSKIQCKAKEETTTRIPSQKNINRRIQSQMNQAEGKITQVAEQTTEHETKLTQQDQDINGIKQTVSETETRLNNDYLTTEQIEAENQTIKDDIEIIKKQQTTVTTTAQGLQVQIDQINNEGVKTVKNTTVDINESGVSVGKSDSEFSTTMNNTGTYMYAYGKQIAQYDKDGMETADLKATGEVEMGYLKLMKTTVNSEKRTHIHWIGG